MGKTQSLFINMLKDRADKKSMFSEAELAKMKNILIEIAGEDATTLNYEQIRIYLQPNMHMNMIKRLFEAMRWEHMRNDVPLGKKSTSVSPIAFLYIVGSLLKGSMANKSIIIRFMVGGRDSKSVTSIALFGFTKDLLTAHLQRLPLQDFGAVTSDNPDTTEASIENLAMALLHKLFYEKNNSSRSSSWREIPLNTTFDDKAIEVWLTNNYVILYMLNQIMLNCFPIHSIHYQFQSFLPKILNAEHGGKLPVTMLDVPSMVFINIQIPRFNLETHEWTLIYSQDKICDPLFITLLQSSSLTDNTLIILEDYHQYRFGAFANDKWFYYPKFRDSVGSFLFTLTPHMSIFKSTGFNNNIMYMNNSDESPQCLGFGGNINFFGLCIWPDSKTGNSYPCLTYNSPQLSSTPRFSIKKLEVWAVMRPKYSHWRSQYRRSVLRQSLSSGIKAADPEI